jgi:hypothetical protein
MSDSNSSSPSSHRPLLKLKSAARKTAPEVKPFSQPPSKLNKKPGAAWSDELKHRMQEEMDALISR